MSGGSYDYLCFAAGDAADLGTKGEALRLMVDRLSGINPDGYAATDTLEVVAAIRAVEALSKRLTDVWRAVEWRDSGDWGDERMMAELAEYEQMRAAEEAE